MQELRARRRSAAAPPLGPAGQTTTVPYLGEHLGENVVGFVAPQSGALFCLTVDGVNNNVFQFLLDEMAKAVPPKEGMRQLLIMDNASWHKASRLNWHHYEPKFLPAY